MLNERYNDPQITISLHLSNLLNLYAVKLISRLKEIRGLHDEVEMQVRNLDNLGLQPNRYGAMLILVLMKKLTVKLRLLFRENLIKTDGTFLNFGKYLNVNSLHEKKLRRNVIQDLKSTYHSQLLIFLLVGKISSKVRNEQMIRAILKTCTSFAAKVTLKLYVTF